MNSIIFINGFALIGLIISFLKNRKKTQQVLFITAKTFGKLAPSILSVILLIGLMYGLMADKITILFGEQSGALGFITIALFGSIIHMPSMLAFPLAGSFLTEGASISSVAAFISTLTMIGVVTLPLEIKTLGKKFAIYRNLFSFIIALIIAFLMGVIL